MNKETNNFTLSKRIDGFKKRYNELLLELNNSSFLNVSKFTNTDLLSASSKSDNISSLLEENSQVNENLELIKNSIKQKLKNLEMLSEKVKEKSNTSIDDNEYISTYDDLIAAEKAEFDTHANSKMSLFRVYDDIERTISKIDRVKEYIEEKVLVKIEESENNKLELTKILEELNEKVKNLVKEKRISQRIIEDLQTSNNFLQSECDKSIESWLSLNGQLDNLHLLIDKNSDDFNELNNEKDQLILEMEAKINDLLFEKANEKSKSEELTETYISNVTDILLEAIHKIFVDLLKSFNDNESSLNCRFKNIQQNLVILLDSINQMQKNGSSLNSIINIDEYEVNDIEIPQDYEPIFNNINMVGEISEIFDEYYLVKIAYLKAKLAEIKKIVVNIQTDFDVLLNPKSHKKINWMVDEVEKYKKKLSDFENEINAFLNSIEQFKDVNLNPQFFNEQYWITLAFFFDKNTHRLNDEIKAIEDVKKLFYEYLLTRQKNNEKKTKEVIVDDTKEDNFEFNTYVETEQETTTIQELTNVVEEQTNFFEQTLENNELVTENETNQETLVLENNEVVEPEFLDDSNQNLDTNVQDVVIYESSFSNNDENVLNPIDLLDTSAPIFKEESDYNTKPILAIQEEIISNLNAVDEINPESLVNDTNQSDVSSEVLENEIKPIYENVEETINDYIDYCGITNVAEHQDLMKMIDDKTQPLYNKIDNIEKILNKLLELNSLNVTNIKNIKYGYSEVDLERKYNKNLKLRLIKSRLYHLKLVIESEQDMKYLKIIERFEK